MEYDQCYAAVSAPRVLIKSGQKSGWPQIRSELEDAERNTIGPLWIKPDSSAMEMRRKKLHPLLC